MNSETIQLVGYQRAEFAKAGRLRIWMIAAQVCTAIPAILSVFIEKQPWLLLFAAFSVIAILAWILFERRYSASRRTSGRARRATLIMGGLGIPISPVELLSIRGMLSVTEAEAAAYEDPDYFASKAPCGRRRLGEMLQESAFWTSQLQGESAKVMWAAFFISMVVSGLAFAVVVGVTKPVVHEQVARVILAVVALLMSGDIVGSAVSHSEASRAIERIVDRLADAEGRQFPEPDVLLILTDYYAIVESAPIAIPGLYKMHRDHLERLFKTFQLARK